MKPKTHSLFSIVILLCLLITTITPVFAEDTPPTVSPKPSAPAQTNRLGAWLDQIVFSAIPDPEPAVAQIQAGAIDMYAVSVDKAEVYEKVKDDPNQIAAFTYGSSNQILFNSVTCTDTSLLNPFSSAKIREAMNWAIDRDYVVKEFFSGLAKPKFTAFTTAFPDYARYADFFSVIENKYSYDLEKARAVVDSEMKAMGAIKGANGKWEYKGKPVVVIGLIRTEDKRKEIGEYFANQLEKLGFTVDRQEKVRSEAAPIWQGDPYPCKFNYYTAGWIAPQIYRDEGLNFTQYNTNELQQLPVFDAYKPSKELKEAGDKLYTNNFKTLEERREIFDKALTLSMQESWWGIWINDTIAFTPYNKKIQGAYDLAGGFALSQLFPFTLRIADQEGGTLKIAQSGILVQPWNPIAGSNWTDDGMIQRAAMDYGVMYDPYTGLYIPKLVTRAEVDALKDLPINAPQSKWVTLKTVDEIKVPDDAWVDWDATRQEFITAAEKAKADSNWKPTARIKSVVYYTPDLWKTTWHDGSPFSVADIVYYMILMFDPGKTESKIYDEAIGETVTTFLTHFKGVKIVSTNPLTIETYEDQFALDAENNIKDWYPNWNITSSLQAGMFAWHDLTPAALAEADGKMAFSEIKSTSKEIEYTSLISGPSLEVQAQYLDKLIADKTIPYAPTMSKYVKPDEAAARYKNLKAWYDTHKHLYIGTGPYFIDKVFPVEGSITATRYDKYIFPADQISGYEEPKLMTLAVEGPLAVAAGEEASFDVTVTFKNQPYPLADLEKVSFTLFNTKGEIAATGEAKSVTDGKFTVTLSKEVTGKLESGTSKLTVASVSKVVSLPVFESVEFVVTK